MRTFISILFTCVFAFQIQAKPDNEKCEGTYSYTFSKSISLEEGEARAVENAVIMALADKFGTGSLVWEKWNCPYPPSAMNGKHRL